VDVAPFRLSGARNAAVLCLHGLTGTPYEVRPLGEACAARGLTAVGPALPGHNGSLEALARVRAEAWLEAARGELVELRRQHERVFVAGLSMGGLLGLALAAEGALDGLAVVGTPLRLRAPLALLVPLLKHLFPYVRKAGGSDIQDEAARARHPSYTAMPLESVHQLLRLQRSVRGLLDRVRAPILVAHGARDRTARPADARRILDRVASRERELLLLAESGHVVPVDRDGPVLANAVAEFFERQLADNPAA